MIYNNKITNILSLIGIPLWLIMTFASLFINNFIIYTILQIILIFIKLLSMYCVNTKIIKSIYGLVLPNIKIIILTCIFYGISYNAIISSMSFFFEKILFITSFSIWLLCLVLNLIYDIFYLIKNKKSNDNNYINQLEELLVE